MTATYHRRAMISFGLAAALAPRAQAMAESSGKSAARAPASKKASLLVGPFQLGKLYLERERPDGGFPDNPSGYRFPTNRIIAAAFNKCRVFLADQTGVGPHSRLTWQEAEPFLLFSGPFTFAFKTHEGKDLTIDLVGGRVMALSTFSKPAIPFRRFFPYLKFKLNVSSPNQLPEAFFTRDFIGPQISYQIDGTIMVDRHGSPHTAEKGQKKDGVQR